MNYNHNSTNTKASMTHPDIHFELRGDHQEVAVIRLTRAAKRNALNDGLILALRDLFEKMPSTCLLYTSPSPRDKRQSRMPSSA